MGSRRCTCCRDDHGGILDAGTLRMDLVPDQIGHDTSFGFLDKSVTSEKLFNPMLVSNFESTPCTRPFSKNAKVEELHLFSRIRQVQTRSLRSKQPFLEFPGRGRIITSTYLGFNSPASFRELANLRRTSASKYWSMKTDAKAFTRRVLSSSRSTARPPSSVAPTSRHWLSKTQS